MLQLTRKNQKQYNAHYGAEINKVVKIGDNVINTFYLSVTTIEKENQIWEHSKDYYIRECDLPKEIAVLIQNKILNQNRIKDLEDALKEAEETKKTLQKSIEKILIGDKVDHIVLFLYSETNIPVSEIQSKLEEGHKLVNYGRRTKEILVALVEVPGIAKQHINSYGSSQFHDIYNIFNVKHLRVSQLKDTGYKVGERFSESVSENLF